LGIRDSLSAGLLEKVQEGPRESKSERLKETESAQASSVRFSRVRSEIRRAGHTRAQRSGTRQQVKLTAAGQLDRYLLPATFRGMSDAPRDKAHHAT